MTDEYAIEALVPHWKNGKNGAWAIIEILSDCPVDKATLNANRLGVQPTVGNPFHCDIKLGKSGWYVARIRLDHLPASLTTLAGVISPDSKPRDKKYLIVPDKPDELNGVTLNLPFDLMKAVHIAWLSPGVTVSLDAARNQHGYDATVLHTPSAALAFPKYADDEGHTQAAILYCMYPWDASKTSKAVMFSARMPDADVAALVWVQTKTLKAIGIRRLVAAALPDSDEIALSTSLVASWSSVLREGTPFEIEALEIDRLSVELETADSGRAWNLHRLLAPSASRLPTDDNEIVDWVSGVVEEIKANPYRKAASTDTQLIVDVAYDDAAIGRGVASAYLSQSTITAVGIVRQTPVVIRLRGRSGRWTVSHIHRATPCPQATPCLISTDDA